MDDKRERGLVPWLKGVVAPRSNKNNGEPYDIFCVVADDERHFREQILRELDCLVQQIVWKNFSLWLLQEMLVFQQQSSFSISLLNINSIYGKFTQIA